MLKRRQMICTGRILMPQKTIVSCTGLVRQECLKDERPVHFLGVLARKEKHSKKKKKVGIIGVKKSGSIGMNNSILRCLLWGWREVHWLAW